jgi:hypothetical protein
MIDIFAIADIRYEILRYLDHFTLMRACCCKDWLTTSRHKLSAVTHTNIINFGYMAACPNLVSIGITSMDEHIVFYKNLYRITLPNIRTVEHKVCGTYYSITWNFLLKIFPNTENIIVNFDCSNYRLHCSAIAHWFSAYPQIKKLTIQNASVNVHAIPLDCSLPVTLIRCSIYSWTPSTNICNLTMLNCTMMD